MGRLRRTARAIPGLEVHFGPWIPRRRRNAAGPATSRWTAATLAVVPAVCALVLVGVVHSLDSGATPSRQIERRVSAAVGAEMTVAGLELGLRPTPRIFMRDAKIRFRSCNRPRAPNGRSRSVADRVVDREASPRQRHAAAPAAGRLQSSQRGAPMPEVGTVYRDTVLAAIDAAAQRIGALSVQANGGKVDFVDGNGSLLALTDLNGEVLLDAGNFALRSPRARIFGSRRPQPCTWIGRPVR